MSKITQFIKETKEEMSHVNWPTRNQAIVYTVLVIVISVVVAYFLGFFDFIFTQGIEKILK